MANIQIFNHSALSANDPESTVSIDLGVTNVTDEFQPVAKFINTEATNNEAWMSLY